MATLLDKRLRTNRIVSVNTGHARAIGDPMRSKILSMLYNKTLSAEEIAVAIHKDGSKKSVSTIRHHIDVLKTTGLIEVTRIDESRGGITKFYGTSIRLLDFEPPENFESLYSSVIDKTTKRLADILSEVSSDIDMSNNTAKPTTADYSAYLLVDIINRATTNILEKDKKRGKKSQQPTTTTTQKATKRGSAAKVSTVKTKTAESRPRQKNTRENNKGKTDND